MRQVTLSSIRYLSLLSLILIFFALPARAAQQQWQPARTWVFMVGSLEFKHKDVYGSFPQENRRDAELLKLFRRQGVPADHMIFLKDNRATLQSIQAEFVTLLEKTQPGDTLFCYYAGHGSNSKSEVCFASYDAGDKGVPGWSAASILPTIDKYFSGTQVLLAADCCYSGYLANRVKEHQGRIQYACLTSASSSEISTEHWTFTDCLLDGFRGSSFVDLNGDGKVSLSELAKHAQQDMALGEKQHAPFTTSAGFNAELVLATAGERASSRIGERVKVKADGEWYVARIINTSGNKFLIHYIGYDDNEDEWVTESRLQLLKPIENIGKYVNNGLIEVEWKGSWYRAKVLKTRAGGSYIHYVGYGKEWDEWVSPERIRQIKDDE